MNFDAYFNKIDTMLSGRGQEKLTENEKELIVAQWRQACLNWAHSPKATDVEFAVYKQLEVALSNAVYDVLHHTRKYEKNKAE